jgi:hypothetical protein
MYDIQHCFICRPSDSTVSEDAGIERRTVATTTFAVRSFTTFRPHPIHVDLAQFFPPFGAVVKLVCTL